MPDQASGGGRASFMPLTAHGEGADQHAEHVKSRAGGVVEGRLFARMCEKSRISANCPASSAATIAA